jgi:hypothetical protein
MGRPWEYPRWKRVLMQAAMWLIFGGTVGLAQLVAHHRRASPQADLGPPRPWGRLTVRLPDGWEIEERESDQILTIEGRDPEDPRRGLTMNQRLGTEAAGGSDDETDGTPISRSSEKIQFTGLGKQGTLTALHEYGRTRQGQPIEQEYLRAFVQTPDGLGVSVGIGEFGTRVGSADRLLLKEIVEGIKPGSADGGPQAGWVHAKAGRLGDTAEVMRLGKSVVVEITSGSGEGDAVITRQGTWPQKLIIRLREMDRLDRFNLSNGRVSLTTRLGQEQPKLRLLGDETSSLMPFDPSYATVVRQKEDGLEVTVPPAMYSGATRQLNVNWTSFVKD